MQIYNYGTIFGTAEDCGCEACNTPSIYTVIVVCGSLINFVFRI